LAQIFIDEGISGNNEQMLNQALLFLFGIIMTLAIFTFARFFLISWTGEKVIADIRGDLIKHILRLSPSYYEKNSTGDILAYIVSDTSLLLTVIGSSLSVAMRNGVLLTGGIIMLVFTSKQLTLMILVLIPLVVAPIIILGRKLRALSRQTQDKVGELSGISEQVLNAIKTVQAYGREKQEQKRFDSKIAEQMALTLKRIFLRGMVTMTVITLVFCGIGTILWFGGHQVLSGDLTAGELTAFIYISIVSAGAVAALSEVFGELEKAGGATDRILSFLATEPEIKDKPNAKRLTNSSKGRIKFDEVTFSYQSSSKKAALSDVSFEIEPGKITALIGKSGAGKSTIFMLLERFYDIQNGAITFDGNNLTDIKISDLRSQFAYVSQDSIVFSGTAYENILYGNPKASKSDVIKAAKSANALEFIERMPEGFNTFLGEKGVRLSGGEKQRIAIARAILNNPKILLLDEATSSLDSENEQLVQKALNNLMVGRTTIVIAHRLSTVVNADKIIVLDKGKVVETGTHKQLISKGKGIYKSLAKLQFNGVE
jgi:ATP-binding cassette subfamily B protein